jgi:uncharacterized membrane protein HdeD (DUF308 family)
MRQATAVLLILLALPLLFQGIRSAMSDPDDGDLGRTGLIVHSTTFIALGILALVVGSLLLRRRA